MFHSSNPTIKGEFVPSSLLEQNLLAPDSNALRCYTTQSFSKKLQVYLVNYVASVTSYYPVYAG